MKNKNLVAFVSISLIFAAGFLGGYTFAGIKAQMQAAQAMKEIKANFSILCERGIVK